MMMMMMMMMIFQNAYLPSSAGLWPRPAVVVDPGLAHALGPLAPFTARRTSTRAAHRRARLAAAVSVVTTCAEHEEMGDPSTARGLRPAHHLLEHHPDRDARGGRRRRPQRDV